MILKRVVLICNGGKYIEAARNIWEITWWFEVKILDSGPNCILIIILGLKLFFKPKVLLLKKRDVAYWLDFNFLICKIMTIINISTSYSYFTKQYKNVLDYEYIHMTQGH